MRKQFHNFSSFPDTESWSFCYSPDCPAPEEIFRNIRTGLPAELKVFKEDGKRRVYLAGADEQQCYIVKINLLPRWKDKFRAQSFAPAEADCQLQAMQRGIPAPRVFALFSRHRWGLTLQNGLVIEYLQDYRAIDNTETGLMIPAFVMLYQKGINHPDFMHRNFMISQTDGSWKIIDLEKCSFLPQPSLLSLLLMLARNIEYGELGFEHPINQDLIRKLYPALGKIPLSFQDFKRATEIIASKHRSSKDRQRMAYPAELKILCHKSSII